MLTTQHGQLYYNIGFNTRWVVIAGGTTDRAPVHDRSEAEVMDWREVGGSPGNDYPTSIKVYSTMFYHYLIFCFVKITLTAGLPGTNKIDARFVSSTSRPRHTRGSSRITTHITTL